MKSSFSFVLLIATAASISASGQTGSPTYGIYLNAEDFQKNKLTYEIECATAKQPYIENSKLNKRYIKIREKRLRRVRKNSIFGYRDCNNVSHRFFHNREYQILNPGEPITLYQSEALLSPRSSDETKYYFSTSPGDNLQELSIENLKKAYRSDMRFCELIDSNFNSDHELILYDAYHSIYKLTRVYLAAQGKS